MSRILNVGKKFDLVGYKIGGTSNDFFYIKIALSLEKILWDQFKYIY